MHARNGGGTYNFGPVSKHSGFLALDLYSGPLKSNNIYKTDPPIKQKKKTPANYPTNLGHYTQLVKFFINK